MAIDTDIPGVRSGDIPDGPHHTALSQSTQDHHPLDFVVLVAEQKRLVLGVTFLCMAIGVAIAFLLPVRYTATIVILPPQQNSSLSSAFASQMDNFSPLAALAGGGLGLKNSNDMYISMLKSKVVEDPIIQRFGLMQEYHRKYISDARKSLERRTTIEGGLKDGLIHISFEDRDKQRAADIATAYVDQLRNLSQKLAITDASHRRLLFERQLDETKNDLASAEEAMQAAQQHTGLIQLDSQARALIESGAMLRAQISAKEVQIEGMRTYATGENAAVAQAEQELAGMRAQLATIGGSKGDGGDDMIVPKGKIPAAGLEYLRRLRDVRYYEAKFTIMARQLEMAKLDEARQGAMIQVVDPALPPDKRSFPHRTLIILFTTLAGLTIGILLVLLRTSLERAESDPTARKRMARLRSALSMKRQRTA